MGGQKTRLIVIHGNLNAQRYINEVLNAEAIPFMQRNGPVVFQQYNACKCEINVMKLCFISDLTIHLAALVIFYTGCKLSEIIVIKILFRIRQYS
jgi:hypothetical protein